uniref:Odorant Binding Protein 10 n=1 Tax=Dendrolimus punctatus TaxID=238572 RepID=A0A2K8GKG0_9NEOP|nr:Odorant Binding Protein 10 [Dendrolimus punctatus]
MVRSTILIVVVLAILSKNSLAISDEKKTQVYGLLFAKAVECGKEVPISDDEILALKNKKLETDNAKCFAACTLKKAGALDEAGKLSSAGSVKAIKDTLTDPADIKSLEDLFAHCSSVNDVAVNDNKSCDRAKLIFDCFRDNADAYGFNLDF